jgi:hypothetical protein
LQDAYIQSIRMGPQDVLNNGLKYTGDPDAKMEIVIGLNAGVISGTVLEDNATTPSINTFIVLVPDAARRGRTDGYRTARTHDAGIFKIGKIPPGEFKSFPWNDVDVWEPESLLRFGLWLASHRKRTGLDRICESKSITRRAVTVDFE